MAYIANDKKMIKAFTDPYILANGGVHSLTASYIFQCDIKEVSTEKGSSGFNPNLSQRDAGKRANHALNYGLGVHKFAEFADISYHQAKLIRDMYLDRIYTKVKRGYWAWIDEEIARHKRVKNLFGWTYRGYDRYGDDLRRQMRSVVPQSSVGYIINQWGIMEVWNDQDLYKPVELLTQTHDSIGFQIRDHYPIEVHTKCLKALRKSLERPLHFEDRTWTIPSDLEAGYNFGKRKANKSSGEVKNPNGMREIDWDEDLEPQLEEILR